MKTFKLLCSVLTVSVLSACNDDEILSYNNDTKFDILFKDNHEKGKSVTVHSEKEHQSNQKHRSSDNFSTRSLIDSEKGEPQYMLVSCPDGVTFKINVDKTGTDEEWTYDVYNGAILNYRNNDKLYIADPKNAGTDFDITFTAVFTDNEYIFVSTPGRVREGQNHRASVNFNINNKQNRYRVRCTDPNVKFKIMMDLWADSDDYYYKNVCDGSEITVPNIVKEQSYYQNYQSGRYDIIENLYFSDPEGGDGKPCQLMLEPITTGSDWMSTIQGMTPISHISIPGTHDSSTFLLGGMSNCQHYDIESQLKSGIRYLDLRIKGGMALHHGSEVCHVDFPYVAEACMDFLKKNASETIILELTVDDNAIDDVKNYILEHSTYFWTKNHIPYIYEVRGKMMIVRRFKTPTLGIDLNSSDIWPDDGVGSGTNSDGVPYYIQDRYFSADETEHDSQEKSELFCNAIDDAINHNDRLTLNFSSIAGRVVHWPKAYAWGGSNIDPIMNYVVRDKIKEISNNYDNPVGVGVIIMDFPADNGNNDDCKIVERIINLNFAKDKRPFNVDIITAYGKH